MGVRGKIEAVIYAAEEPVTLAQLTALFGQEALAERTEQGDSAAIEEPPAEEAEQLPLEEAPQAESFEPPSEGLTVPEVEAEGQPQTALPEAGANDMEEPYQATGEPTLIGDPDADRRAARLRDRLAREAVRAIVTALIADYETDARGMEIREIAGGYRVATKPEYHDAVRAFAKSLKPPMKLSLQALETLAVIAYKQPVTAPEVSEIRGVDSGGVLGSLISRKLVTTAGRKQVVGRPILYKTTKEFLLRFGLKDLAELPSMEEFEKMASELESLGEEPSAAEAAPLLAPAEATADAPEPDSPVIEVDAADPASAGLSVEEDGSVTADGAEPAEPSPEPVDEPEKAEEV